VVRAVRGGGLGLLPYAEPRATDCDDELVKVKPLLDLVPRWAEHLSADPAEVVVRQLRRSESTGRPAGDERFVKRLERIVGRVLHPGRPGRKRKAGRK
jgi:putative transposase